MKPIADLILQNGRVTTLDPRHPSATEVVIAGNPLNVPQWMLGPRGLLDGGCECFAF